MFEALKIDTQPDEPAVVADYEALNDSVLSWLPRLALFALIAWQVSLNVKLIITKGKDDEESKLWVQAILVINIVALVVLMANYLIY
jgi:hypothetical protein